GGRYCPRRRRIMKRLLLAAAATAFLTGDAAALTRIKDITSVVGVRDNQLIGYGLVIGLNGSGDSMRNSPFTEQSLQAMLDRMGVNVTGVGLRVRNVASVMVTANLPPFATVGSRIDIDISSVGDAISLKGGTLLMTPLAGGDGEVYAMAQGPVAVSGFAAEGAAASVSEGVPTSGHISNGALVEKAVPGALNDLGPMVLQLYNPDFATATEVADAINDFTQLQYGKRLAHERDKGTVVIDRPASVSPTRYLAQIGELLVAPDTAARVVVNERTGTVVIGQDVQISSVAIAHGNLTARITEKPVAAEPNPLSLGKTVVLPRSTITVDEGPGHTAMVNGASLDLLVDGLNRIGLKPT